MTTATGNESKDAARDSDSFAGLLAEALTGIEAWERGWPAFGADATMRVEADRLRAVLGELVERVGDNYPFFHPGYAGQMLKPPHPIAALAYAVAQRINPNNHALDGGPATAAMEHEVVAQLARMFGYETHLGHLTSSGTIANLEALWVARELHPGKAIAYSEQAHYTHARMCGVIGVEGIALPVDGEARLDLAAVEQELRSGRIGTIVVTAGTTSLGAVDRIDEILPVARRHGVRVHVDAAYGGFFVLLAGEQRTETALSSDAAAAFRAIAGCDSVVVDPHKHGLQPYGCGSVIFRDPTVGRFYRHDSPYTYFTSDELHLGEISLECSRAGAAAAALWATLRCFPLEPNGGLGAILRRTRGAAARWADLIRADERLELAVEPALDIVTFYVGSGGRRASEISEATERIFRAGMSDAARPLYLAKLGVAPPLLQGAGIEWDQPTVTVLRTCLMKPEHFDEIPRLHGRLLEVLG